MANVKKLEFYDWIFQKKNPIEPIINSPRYSMRERAFKMGPSEFFLEN
jgi:hypothetical protein